MADYAVRPAPEPDVTARATGAGTVRVAPEPKDPPKTTGILWPPQ